MECPVRKDRQDALLEYSSGRGAGAASLRSHVETCPECLEFVARQAAVQEALEQWTCPGISPEFNAKLYARIEAGERRSWLPWRIGWFANRWWRPAIPLGLASVILAGIMMFHSPAPRGQEPGETVDADRLERAFDDLDMLRQLNAAARPDQAAATSM